MVEGRKREAKGTSKVYLILHYTLMYYFTYGIPVLSVNFVQSVCTSATIYYVTNVYLVLLERARTLTRLYVKLLIKYKRKREEREREKKQCRKSKIILTPLLSTLRI